jgi:tetratricopeptide (TPR) repeat protein
MRPRRTRPSDPRQCLGSVLLLGLLACGGSEADSILVPELPSFIEGFDPRVEELVRVTHESLAREPADPEHWMELGRVFEAHSESALAVPYYQGAVALDQSRARWWYRLAMALGASDRIEDALGALDRSIALDGVHGPAHWRRGLWLLEMDRPADAREAFGRSLELDPEDPAGILGVVQVHLHLREYEAAAAALEEHPVLRGPNGPFARKLLGTAYQRMGREESARLLLASAKNARPAFSDPWNQELDALRRGLAAINRQARHLIARGRVLEAVRILEKGQALEPGHLPILRTLGAAYATVGRTKDAYEVLLAAAAEDPGNGELRVDVAWARAMFGELEPALADVTAILAEDPTNNKAHVLRAQLLLDLERGAEAVDAFAEAMAHGAREPRMLVDIGRTQLELGRPGDARASFVLASEQDPMHQDAWIGCAIACLELGDAAGAEVAIGRAEELVAFQRTGDAPVLDDIRGQLTRLKNAESGGGQDDG